MNAKPRTLPHINLIIISTTIRSIDIELMNADPSLTRHQTSRPWKLSKVIPMTRIRTHGIVVTIVNNMDLFLRIK